MNQELILQASFLERQSQEMQNSLELIEREILDLEKFDLNLKVLSESREKEILAPFGKGTYIKSEIIDKKLFVEVGAGVIVKKTPEEARSLVQIQIRSFREARSSFIVQLENNNLKLNDSITKIEKEKQSS